MNKGLQDGLLMDNSVFLIDEKRPGYSIWVRIIQFLAIVIGCWSSISVLIEGLNLPVGFLSVNITVLICSGILYGICLFPSYDAVKLFFGALCYGLYFYSRLPKILNGFYILENHILARFASYYGFQSQDYIADYTTATQDSTLLIIMIVIPFVSLLTVAILRNRFVNLCSLLLFIPISLSFAFGIVPTEVHLVAFVASILYLTHSGYSSHQAVNMEQKTLLHRINSRAAVLFSLMSLLIFFVMKLFVSKEDYQEIPEIHETKKEIQTSLFNFSLEDVTDSITDIKLPSYNKAVGGLDGGDLGNVAEVEYTGSEQLRVIAPLMSVSEGIYLKGYVGSVYTGDSWDKHSKETEKKYKALLKEMPVEEFLPVNQVGLLLNGIRANKYYENSGLYNYGKIVIEYKAANKKYMYAPYFTDYELLEDIEYKQDLYAAPAKKKDEYTFQYYYFNMPETGYTELLRFTNATISLDNYAKYEKTYRDFVYQTYTEVPEEGLERLKKEFSEVKDNTESDNIYDRIIYIKDYLSDNTQYSLSPGKLPKGRDYVEYFLYVNKLGYCSHYATAATLMLRIMGIPARYVEGYAAGASNITNDYNGSTKKLEVELLIKDYNAHAWVEVYIDNCGWIPMEFTPGSSYDYSVLENIAVIGDIAAEEEAQVTPTQAPPEPTEAVISEEDEPEQEKSEQEESEQEDVSPATGNHVKQENTLLDTLFMIFFILLAIGLLTGLFLLSIIRRRRLWYRANHNKKAILLFAEIGKILACSNGIPKRGALLEDYVDYVKENCSYLKPEEFESAMETVKKARFGRGRISLDELKKVVIFRNGLYNKVYEELSISKKLYLKLILNIL